MKSNSRVGISDNEINSQGSFESIEDNYEEGKAQNICVSGLDTTQKPSHCVLSCKDW